MRIIKLKKTLCDGSEVYNVRMYGGDGDFAVACLSDQDANAFIDKLANAVEQHTSEYVPMETIMKKRIKSIAEKDKSECDRLKAFLDAEKNEIAQWLLPRDSG